MRILGVLEVRSRVIKEGKRGKIEGEQGKFRGKKRKF